MILNRESRARSTSGSPLKETTLFGRESPFKSILKDKPLATKSSIKKVDLMKDSDSEYQLAIPAVEQPQIDSSTVLYT